MTDIAAVCQPESNADTPARSVGRTVGMTFSWQVLVFGLGTIFGILTARYLGVAGKGQLATVLVTAGLLNVLLDCGLRTVLTRNIAGRIISWRAGVLTLLTVHFSLLLLIIVPAYFLLRAWRIISPDVLSPALSLLTGLILVLSLLEGSLISALAGHKKMPETVGAFAAGKCLSLVALTALTIFFHFQVIGAVTAVTIGIFVEIIYLYLILQRLEGGLMRFRHDLLRGWFRFGATCQAGNLATQLNYRLDALLVFSLAGAPAAGLYAVAVSLAELPLHLPNSIASVIMPQVSSESDDSAQRTIRFSRFTIQIISLSAVLFAIFGPLLIPLLYGTPYTGAYTALLLLLPGIIMLGLSKVLAADLIGRGYPNYTAWSSWVGLTATFGLDLWLIPGWGICGAALATSIAYIAAAFLLIHAFSKVTGNASSKLFGWTFEESIAVAHLLASRTRRTLMRSGGQCHG